MILFTLLHIRIYLMENCIRDIIPSLGRLCARTHTRARVRFLHARVHTSLYSNFFFFYTCWIDESPRFSQRGHLALNSNPVQLNLAKATRRRWGTDWRAVAHQRRANERHGFRSHTIHLCACWRLSFSLRNPASQEYYFDVSRNWFVSPQQQVPLIEFALGCSFSACFRNERIVYNARCSNANEQAAVRCAVQFNKVFALLLSGENLDESRSRMKVALTSSNGNAFRF